MAQRRALPLAERVAADGNDLVALDDAPGGLLRRLSGSGEFKPTHVRSFLLFCRLARLEFPGTSGGTLQAEIFAQGLAGVILVEQAAALQFRHDVIDEVGVSARHIGCRDDKAVAAAIDEHLLEYVRDLLRAADDGVLDL